MTLDGRRVLVTGAGGMLGSAVVRALVDQARRSMPTSAPRPHPR
jgi:nucleoside-diphosphate-sugar epimerase